MSGGRPTKLSSEVSRTICDALRRGNYVETAAALAGVSKTTVYAWLREGARCPESAEGEFSNAVKKAQAEAEAGLLEIIGEAAQGGAWPAAAWRLERMYPERWGRKDRVKVETEQAAAERTAAGSDNWLYVAASRTDSDDDRDDERDDATYPQANP